MKGRTLVLLLLVFLLVVLYKPAGVWGEMQRMWAERERIWRVMFIMVGIYFLYGIYSMYSRGMFSWLFTP